MSPNASHRTPGLSYRPTAHQDARQHASKAKAHQGYLDALHKASCDLCNVSLGLLHTDGKMWDIRDPHYTFDLKLLCLPCTEAMEGRIAKGIQEPPDIFEGALTIFAPLCTSSTSGLHGAAPAKL